MTYNSLAVVFDLVFRGWTVQDAIAILQADAIRRGRFYLS
jgi:hypothetical protein